MLCRPLLPGFLGLFALAACAGPQPQTPASRASAAALASCRSSADSSFNRQNRFLLSERDQTDTPFSTSGITGITTQGLTRRLDYDDQLQACLTARNAATPDNLSAASGAPSGRDATTPLAP